MKGPRAVDRLGRVGLVLVLAGCGVAAPSGVATLPATTTPATTTAPAVTASSIPSAPPTPTATARSTPTAAATRTPASFPIAVFAGLGDEPVSDELAAELQEVLDTAASGRGLTAAVISPQGTWNGASGIAAGDRQMRPDDQMSIGHITQTLVAAQVMQLVEAGELSLDDFASDRLPPGLEFDTNGATIADLVSHRSGLPEDFFDPGVWDSITTDPLRAWTPEEVLATVGPERGPVGREWEFIGTNYVLLGVILEHVTGRPLAEVLRSGVLSGDGYERLIYQPDERPTEPMAMPSGASPDTFDEVGGYLPSLAKVTAEITEANMASDAPSLARWWRAFCAGEVVSPASLDEMTDLRKRPEYGLGIWDRRLEYGAGSGALGHVGVSFGFSSMALCFPQQGIVVVVLANAEEHDVGTTAGNLWRAAST